MSFFEFPNTRTYDDDLGWIIKTIKEVIDKIEELEEFKLNFKEAYDELIKIYNEIVSGKFPPTIIEAFEKWMRENAINIVGELVHSVYFGLTDAGYFTAYIPESWNDIIFKTTGWDVYTTLQPEYGHLVLEY